MMIDFKIFIVVLFCQLKQSLPEKVQNKLQFYLYLTGEANHRKTLTFATKIQRHKENTK